ncbi:E3 ubiquitin-protein ligase RNF4 [Pelomyxa schiedti]|nr:E3 ubiquitin-protein ligase RNF4 [Pelomyxa schiedti]
MDAVDAPVIVLSDDEVEVLQVVPRRRRSLLNGHGAVVNGSRPTSAPRGLYGDGARGLGSVDANGRGGGGGGAGTTTTTASSRPTESSFDSGGVVLVGVGGDAGSANVHLGEASAPNAAANASSPPIMGRRRRQQQLQLRFLTPETRAPAANLPPESSMGSAAAPGYSTATTSTTSSRAPPGGNLTGSANGVCELVGASTREPSFDLKNIAVTSEFCPRTPPLMEHLDTNPSRTHQDDFYQDLLSRILFHPSDYNVVSPVQTSMQTATVNTSSGTTSPIPISSFDPTSPILICDSPVRQPYYPTSPSSTPPPYTPTSPGSIPGTPFYEPSSPTVIPASPTIILSSPVYGSTSPLYSPTTPVYSPTSPGYRSVSPVYSGYRSESPMYAPRSPRYTPYVPANTRVGSFRYDSSRDSPESPPLYPSISPLDSYNTTSLTQMPQTASTHSNASSWPAGNHIPSTTMPTTHAASTLLPPIHTEIGFSQTAPPTRIVDLFSSLWNSGGQQHIPPLLPPPFDITGFNARQSPLSQLPALPCMPYNIPVPQRPSASNVTQQPPPSPMTVQDVIVLSDSEDSSPKKASSSSSTTTTSTTSPSAPRAQSKTLSTQCPICLTEITTCTSTKCGHVFCEKCIRHWLRGSDKCPTCRGKISVKSLRRIFVG